MVGVFCCPEIPSCHAVESNVQYTKRTSVHVAWSLRCLASALRERGGAQLQGYGRLTCLETLHLHTSARFYCARGIRAG